MDTGNYRPEKSLFRKNSDRQQNPWEGPDGNTWALYELRDAAVT